MTSPEDDHAATGLAEVGVHEIKAQTRILRSQLEQRLGNRIDEKDPLMSWIPRHEANCVSRYKLIDDGRTPGQRRCGNTWRRPVVEFGESVHFRPVGENNALRGGDQRMLRRHHERSGAAIFLTPDGVKRRTRIARMLEHERWDRVFSATCIGVRWQWKPDQRNLARPVVPEAEADQGVALVIVMLAASSTDRRRCVTKRDLVKYGDTDECQACTQLASGMHNAKGPHDHRCRDRIGELRQRTMTRDKLSVRPGLFKPRVRKPEKRWTMANRRSRKINNQFSSQFPQFEWGGSSSSGTRSRVGSRASETNTDDRETKSVRFTESRGQKRQGEVWKNWQRRRKNNILMQMLKWAGATRHGE